MIIGYDKNIRLPVILLLAFLSMGTGLKEQLTDYQPSSPEERALSVVAPDTVFGQPVFLYSATGRPYRCYLRSDGLPLSCRRTEAGTETEDALRHFTENKLKTLKSAVKS